MNNSDVLKARTDYCVGKTCGNCIFGTYAIKFNTRCYYLTIDQIYEILQLIKEEESMTKKEEIQQEIEKTQKQLAALQEKLKEAEDKVPDKLEFANGEIFYCVDETDDLKHRHFDPLSASSLQPQLARRAFKDKQLALIMQEKTQFIADLLHFKYLYDRDYEPDWNNSDESKWYICYNGRLYECDTNYVYRNPSVIYFSSEEVARKCATWLNKKYDYTKE